MSIFEKVCIIGSLAGMGIGSMYLIGKASISSSSSKNQIYDIRKKIIQNENIKILYSTMSFFYLQGYKQNSLDSLFLLYDILSVSTPNIIALQISEEEYNEKYMQILKHPRFSEIMNKVQHHLKLKSEEILNMKEIELQNLENLYCIHYCRNKKCKVIFGDHPQNYVDNLYKSKLQMNDINKENKEKNPNFLSDIKQIVPDKIKTNEELYNEVYFEEREQFYVDNLMEALTPKIKLMPEAPYKTIVGVVSPKHTKGIAEKWKNKFLSVYGHQIMEGEENDKSIQEEKDNSIENKEIKTDAQS